jgi:hypothetical protein
MINTISKKKIHTHKDDRGLGEGTWNLPHLKIGLLRQHLSPLDYSNFVTPNKGQVREGPTQKKKKKTQSAHPAHTF